MKSFEYALALMGLLGLLSCGSDEASPEAHTRGDSATETAPPEIFSWSDCAIEFAPPSSDWKRQRSQGSVEGVSFRIARVPPGVIEVGYYRSLHRNHTTRSLASGRERRFEPPAPGFTLADVVDRVRFDPQTLPHPDRVLVQPEVACSVGGLRALSLDYTWRDIEHTFHGREAYVVAGEHLFVAKVRGTEADLELFDRIVATIRFHPDHPSPE